MFAYYRGENANLWKERDHITFVGEITAEGLEEATNYYFKLKATSENGDENALPGDTIKEDCFGFLPQPDAMVAGGGPAIAEYRDEFLEPGGCVPCLEKMYGKQAIYTNQEIKVNNHKIICDKTYRKFHKKHQEE